LRLVLLADQGQPPDLLLMRLSPAEREQAEQNWPAGCRRRQFLLSRLAAHRAVQRLLAGRVPPPSIQVLSGPAGEPRARVDGVEGVVSVSLAHSGRLALACAWPGARRHTGVDLERVRPTDVAHSRYAFSRRERALLARAPEGLALAGLAAWTAKEAAWKALWPHQPVSPAGIEIRALDLERGCAVAQVPPGRAQFEVRIGFIAGPDGPYLLSIAQLTQRAARNPFGGDINHE